MRSYLLKAIPVAAMAGLLLSAGGCSHSPIDNPSADVVLQVATTQTPPVTVQDQNGTCIATVPPWNVEFTNVPKSAGATQSPFNDITVRTVTLTYTWPAGVTGPATAVIGLPLTVPADSSASGDFYPLNSSDWNSSMESATASVVISVDAVTAVGEQVGITIVEQLFIEACKGGGP